MEKNKTTVIAEPCKQELFIIREFDAPRELVFQANTDPELFVQWMGPKQLTMDLHFFNAVDGGGYHYTSKDLAGNEYAFRGVYHEVVAPERMIGTFEFLGLPEKGHVEFDTSRFEALPGDRTRLTIHAIYQSVQDRDMMIKSGMEGGITEGFIRLDALLAGMAVQ
ncbi:SRPBCC family protein [Ferruginibacter sp.]